MKNSSGFTLIELMITVAIIAILSAIAFPSYTAYIQRGKLAEMKSALMVSSVRLEKSNIALNKYPEAGSGAEQFNTADIEHSNKYSYSYARGASDVQSFYLKGEETKLKIWAGINSNGIRCACKNCGPSANITFTETTNACPINTESF